MFYTGKSTACHTCRQRRLKCDEVRPHCLKCRRAGRECLGYREESAFIIRDMTTATIQKFEHRTKSNPSGSSTDGSASEQSKSSRVGSSRGDQSLSRGTSASSTATTALSTPPTEGGLGDEGSERRVRKQRSFLGNSRRKQTHDMVVKPALVGLPLEDRAFCYFANRYAFAPTQYLDPGYLPVLKLVSQRKNASACLSYSLSAVSLAAFSTKLNARKTILRARSAYATALHLTNEAIQHPDSCRDDELLASVVLLALFEVSSSHSPWLSLARAHIDYRFSVRIVFSDGVAISSEQRRCSAPAEKCHSVTSWLELCSVWLVMNR
jgi:hypothetical protein